MIPGLWALGYLPRRALTAPSVVPSRFSSCRLALIGLGKHSALEQEQLARYLKHLNRALFSALEPSWAVIARDLLLLRLTSVMTYRGVVKRRRTTTAFRRVNIQRPSFR